MRVSENFPNECYDKNLNLIDEMERVIKITLDEYKKDPLNNVNRYVEDIMKLIYSTKYEW